MDKIPHSERLQRTLRNPLVLAALGAASLYAAREGGSRLSHQLELAIDKRRSHKILEGLVLKALGDNSRYELMEVTFARMVADRTINVKGELSGERLATILGPLYDISQLIASGVTIRSSDIFSRTVASQVTSKDMLSVQTLIPSIDLRMRSRVQQELRITAGTRAGVTAKVAEDKLHVMDRANNVVAWATVQESEDGLALEAHEMNAWQGDAAKFALFAALHEVGIAKGMPVDFNLPISEVPAAKVALSGSTLYFPSRTPALPNMLLPFITADKGVSEDGLSRQVRIFDPQAQNNPGSRFIFKDAPKSRE